MHSSMLSGAVLAVGLPMLALTAAHGDFDLLEMAAPRLERRLVPVFVPYGPGIRGGKMVMMSEEQAEKYQLKRQKPLHAGPTLWKPSYLSASHKPTIPTKPISPFQRIQTALHDPSTPSVMDKQHGDSTGETTAPQPKIARILGQWEQDPMPRKQDFVGLNRQDKECTALHDKASRRRFGRKTVKCVASNLEAHKTALRAWRDKHGLSDDGEWDRHRPLLEKYADLHYPDHFANKWRRPRPSADISRQDPGFWHSPTYKPLSWTSGARKSSDLSSESSASGLSDLKRSSSSPFPLND